MALKLQKTKGYFRDGFTNFDEMTISIASSPVLYGLGVYTVFYAGWDDHNDQLRAFRLEDHYNRLCSSARIMQFADFAKAYSFSQFKNIMLDILRLNKVRENALIRVSWFVDAELAGTKTTGLPCSMAAFVYPASPLYPASGITMGVSSWQRTPDNAIPPRAKVHGNYVNATLAKNEALRHGYDEAILLDAQGQVAESTVTNICIVRNDQIITPGPSTDLLEGITSQSIEALAKHLDIPFTRRSIDRTELYQADEIFITGSSAGITPVIAVDGQKISGGTIGTLTSRLAKLYSEVRLGTIPEFRHWLFDVYEK